MLVVMARSTYEMTAKSTSKSFVLATIVLNDAEQAVAAAAGGAPSARELAKAEMRCRR